MSKFTNVEPQIFVGRVGGTPVSEGEGKKPFASFNLATTEEYVSKSGDNVVKTQWHKIICFGKTAEIVKQHVQKGALLYVQAKLDYAEFEDKDGYKRNEARFIASRIGFLENKQIASNRLESEPSTNAAAQ